MGQESNDQLDSNATIPPKNVKHSYTRELLLSFTESNSCNIQPSGLDTQILRNYVVEGVNAAPSSSTRALIRRDRRFQVLEHASLCLTQIAESFASFPDKLDELCNDGLVAQATRIISVSSSGGAHASLNTPTYTGLIRLLSTCASGLTLARKTLLLLGISGILKYILVGSGLVSSISTSPALNRPPEQVYPAWRWFEKEDGIMSLQKNNKDPAPEF